MIDKIIEELESEKQKHIIPIGGRRNGKFIEYGFCLGINKAIEIVKKHEVEFYNYELYCNLLEENEKLKEEIELLNETSLNEEYWKVLELFQKECETNFELRKQIALLPNDLSGETVELIREKGNE